MDIAPNEEVDKDFNRVLQYFLRAKTRLKNDVYLETLLTHLKTDHTYKLDFSWFEQLVTKIETNQSPHHSIISFGIRFAILCGERDINRTKLLVTSGLLDRLVKALDENTDLKSVSVEISLIQLLKQIVTTVDEGLDWFKSTQYWKTIINYEKLTYTVYSIRETAWFLHDVLREFDLRNDKESCLSVLQDILSPFINSIWLSQDMLIDVCNTKAHDVVMKSLKLLEQIYLKLIEHPELCHIPFYLRTLNSSRRMWMVMDIAQDYDLSCQLIKVATLDNFLHFTCFKVPDGEKMESITIEKFSINYYNSIQFAIRRSNAGELVLVATELMNKLLYRIGPRRLPDEAMHDSYNLKFGDQIYLMMLMPSLLVVKRNAPEEMIDLYCSRIYTNCGEQTLRHLYALRDTIRNKKDVTETAVRYMQALCFSNKALQRHHAIYTLETFSVTILGFMLHDASADPPVLQFENPRLLLATLQGLNNLITDYNITHTDLHDTDLLKLAMYLVNVRLETKIMVEAIKFLELCIRNFLGNNTSLIMNEIIGSGLEKLSQTIFKRMHDVDWEVRDSILELLIIVVDLSNQKYDTLQTQLLENNICPVVVAMTKNDCECYVRATALKCLCKMTKVPKLWSTVLKSMELLDYLTTVLATEDEAIVRREAVETLKVVYCTLRAPKNNKVLSTMVHCAAIDLHWEVRLNALDFWKTTLENCLAQQGMSDGRFPQQIFSTEHKKIITLDEKEIHNRITRGLTTFGTNGGLGVLLANLDDTTDIEVVKASVAIIQNLLNKLNRYDYVQKLLSIPEESNGVTQNSTKPNHDAEMDELSNGAPNEEVLENIVNANDINLLIGAHQNAIDNLQLENQFEYLQVTEKYEKVTPREFFTKSSKINLDEILIARSEWLTNTSSLASLLEDIIFSFKDSDINDMDCY